MSAPGGKTGLTARLLASAALILVSGGYALWQPGRQDEKAPVKLVRAKLPAPALPPAAEPQRREAPPVLPLTDTVPPPRPEKPQGPPPPREEAAAPPPVPEKAAGEAAPEKVAEEAPPPKPKLILPTYSDGDYTGEPVDSDFGPVQVEVLVQGGKITDIKFLQIPDHRRRSAEISEAAIPMLVQEAIQAQGPRIDIISQATYTTITFANALYSALSKAEK
jgi:uncharacterized protein with FMN-binding domain